MFELGVAFEEFVEVGTLPHAPRGHNPHISFLGDFIEFLYHIFDVATLQDSLERYFGIIAVFGIISFDA
jgi:hypothetical protein